MIPYHVVMHSWQWLYLGLVCMSTLFLVLTAAMGLRRPPMWMALPAVLGMLIWFTPYGLVTIFALHVLLFTSAPIEAGLIASAFTLGCWWLGMTTLFPFIGRHSIKV